MSETKSFQPCATHPATVLRVTVVMLLVMPRAGATQSSPTRTVDTTSIGRAVNAWMQQHGAPALSVAVALDGKPAWSAGFGFADPAKGVPAKPHTSYRLASVTKSITATAVMMLAEKGALDLDAPIQRYCPAYPEKRWPITARLLLAHLAGVRHHTFAESMWPSTEHFESVPLLAQDTRQRRGFAPSTVGSSLTWAPLFATLPMEV